MHNEFAIPFLRQFVGEPFVGPPNHASISGKL